EEINIVQLLQVLDVLSPALRTRAGRAEASTLAAQSVQVLGPLTNLVTMSGRANAAIRLARRAVAGVGQLTDGEPAASSRGVLAGLYSRAGRLLEAELTYEAAIPIHRAVSDGFGEVDTLCRLGELYQHNGWKIEAERTFQKALRMCWVMSASAGYD